MSEASNAAQAAGAAMSAGSAAIKHTAFAAGGGLTLGAIIVMALTMPSKKSDFFAALISTVVSSLSIGAYAVQKLGLIDAVMTAQTMLHLYIALAQIGGVFFVCGLPGWVFVRSAFVFSEARKLKGLDVMIADIKQSWK